MVSSSLGLGHRSHRDSCRPFGSVPVWVCLNLSSSLVGLVGHVLFEANEAGGPCTLGVQCGHEYFGIQVVWYRDQRLALISMSGEKIENGSGNRTEG